MAAEGKRIVFTNETPNDQGFITRNSTIDFSHYNINPVLLANHDWKSLPIGKMTKIQLESNGDYTGIPVFHKITSESKTYSALYEGGWLSTASIGSTMLFKKDLGTGRYATDEKGNQIGEYNKDGYLETARVTLLEISLPTLPSNYKAATKEALENAFMNAPIKLMAYSEDSINEMSGQLVTLESQLNELNINAMAKETEKETVLETEKTIEKSVVLEKEQVVEKSPEQEIDKSNHVILSAKPSMIEKLIDLAHATFGKKLEKATKLDEDGEMAKKEETKGEKTEKLCDTLGVTEEKGETDKHLAKDKEEKGEADKELAMSEKEEEKSEGDSNNKKEEEKDEEKIEEKNKEIEKKEALSSEPQIKTKLEMEQDKNIKLAADPKKPEVYKFGEGVTFSKLAADKGGDGERILGRIFDGKSGGNKDINDYKIVLKSAMADKKYSAILDKSRFHLCGDERQMMGFRHDLSALNRQNTKVGINFNEILSRLESGQVMGINYGEGGRSEIKTALSTSASFASLDTFAVEWLSQTIFTLFPQEDWREDIPMFGVAETGRNLGIIWTNIAANPAIYRGTNPSPAAAYTYNDTAVVLKLTPYWLQPMRWIPMDYHQFRYNQQDTGWAQAMNKLNAQINDDLLYTLAAGALASSQGIVYTGGPIDSTQAQSFAAGSGINKFYFNNFVGNLTKPGYNDILAIEQNFAAKNFDLAKERVIAVVDPITNSYIKQDKQTQSYLTRWIESNEADVLKISHTKIHERSRVVAYDQVGGTIVDCNATSPVIPTTTQSANLAIVSSQVGIGLGLIDVFAVQDPANYGFVQSLDLRIGTRALRNNYDGVTIYAYGPNPQAGQ